MKTKVIKSPMKKRLTFPKYVALYKNGKLGTALALTNDYVYGVKNAYEYIRENGNWSCIADWKEDKLVVMSCYNNHLIGTELREITRDQYLKDEGLQK